MFRIIDKLHVSDRMHGARIALAFLYRSRSLLFRALLNFQKNLYQFGDSKYKRFAVICAECPYTVTPWSFYDDICPFLDHWWHPDFCDLAGCETELGPYIQKFCQHCRCIRRVYVAMNPVWAQHHDQYESSLQHLRIRKGVLDNLYLPPGQRDKRFYEACKAYDVAFGDHLPSAFHITEGLVPDPLVHGSGGEHGSESEDFPDDVHDVDYYDNSHVESLDCDFHDDVWSALDDVYA